MWRRDWIRGVLTEHKQHSFGVEDKENGYLKNRDKGECRASFLVYIAKNKNQTLSRTRGSFQFSHTISQRSNVTRVRSSYQNYANKIQIGSSISNVKRKTVSRKTFKAFYI